MSARPALFPESIAAAPEAVQPREEPVWRSGFGTLLRLEMRAWWGRPFWLIQSAIWLVVVDGFLAAVFSSGGDAQTAISASDALFGYFVAGSLFTVLGVIVLMQNAVIGERERGTAAWVLSKPVSRGAFLASKLVAQTSGIVFTMTLVPAPLAYLIVDHSLRHSPAVGPFLVSFVGLQALYLLFYLTFTLMLGVMARWRGVVIGVALALLGLMTQMAKVSWASRLLPSGLTTIAPAPLLGRPLPSLWPIATTLLLTVLFAAVAIWHFSAEDL